MRSRTTVVMICLGLMLSLAALPAAAMEILQLTHGSVVIGGSPSSAAVVNVAGPRLSITTFQSPLFTLVPCGNGCVAGDLYEVGWHSVDWVGGGVTLDGVTNPFANASPLGDGLSISQGVLSFTAPSPIEAAQVVLTFPV